jgi:pSer/pThr/pTyr-binding forkhead associated (FHA) protein
MPAVPARPRKSEEPRNNPRTLVVTEGSLQGTTITLGQAPVLIGRAPECTLVLDDDYASSRHAKLSLQQGRWMVEDLGSTNGTFLGRNRVETATPLEVGSPVRIGRTVMELRR